MFHWQMVLAGRLIIRRKTAFVFAFFGDGAMHQGAFLKHCVWHNYTKLPCIFICENNGYAMGTSLERQSAITELCRRADGVGMINERVDGFDVEHVRERTALREYARSGKGPVLLRLSPIDTRATQCQTQQSTERKEEKNDHKKNRDPLLITKVD